MATKQDFTTEEWGKLLEGTLLASVAVTTAEPSGLWGALKEGFANAKSVVAGGTDSSAVVRDLVADLKTSEGRTIAQDLLKARLKGLKAADISAAAVTGLNDVAAILDAKDGADAAHVKQWIYDTADKVANAASEGGFLGFGGEKVSPKERATLAQISAALKIA